MKKIYLTLFIALGSLTTIALNAQSTFISIWDTEKPGLYNLETEIPASGEYTYSWVKVELNGNSYDTIGQGGSSGYGDNFNGNTIYFPTDGIYRVEISPDNMNGTPFHRITFNNGGDKLRLLRIEQWGTSIEWSSFAGAFYGCENLIIASNDNPQLSNVTDMSFMFAGATSITNIGPSVGELHTKEQGVGNWDVGHVVNMSHMFEGASSFDADLSSWDVSSVTDMSFMFANATQISSIGPIEGELHTKEQGVGNWDVGHVVNMSHMFDGASSFDQDLSSWNVSNVTDMSFMFANASQISSMGPSEGELHTKEQGVGNWDVGQVVNMEGMFNGATNFDQNLGSWNIGQLGTSGTPTSNDISFANSGMSCGNYSETLLGWANQTGTASNVTLDATGMEYSPDVTADHDQLTSTKNWTITGDSEGNCHLSIEEFNTSSFTIYPNPTQDQFTITGLSGNESIQLIDMTGRILQTVVNHNQTTQSIEVNQLANGVYNLVISSENGQKVIKKLVKQ